MLEQGTACAHGPELCLGGIARVAAAAVRRRADRELGLGRRRGRGVRCPERPGAPTTSSAPTTARSSPSPRSARTTPTGHASEASATSRPPAPSPREAGSHADPSRALGRMTFGAEPSVAAGPPGLRHALGRPRRRSRPRSWTQLAEGEPVCQIMNVVVTDDVAARRQPSARSGAGRSASSSAKATRRTSCMAIREEAERFIPEELGLEMIWSQEASAGPGARPRSASSSTPAAPARPRSTSATAPAWSALPALSPRSPSASLR